MKDQVFPVIVFTNGLYKDIIRLESFVHLLRNAKLRKNETVCLPNLA